MTVKAFSNPPPPQETLELAHSTVVRPRRGARLESESLGLGPAGPCDLSLPGLLLPSVLRMERPPPVPVSHECVRTDDIKHMTTLGPLCTGGAR